MSAEARTLIDELLVEQSRLTAVEAFSRAHERPAVGGARYAALLPAAPPRPGEQYAFEVDLDRCSGCKACVTACHSLNGLDDGETWREIGGLIGEDWRAPFQQTVTTACHHCVDPGCLQGCPVLAYEKDPVTGIVRHLDDQCIGCQYCVLKCPYEVPRYSERRGIVRKCDMCSQRLAVGEAPACAQACPNEAIKITVVQQTAVRQMFRSDAVFDERGEASAMVRQSFQAAGQRGKGEKEKWSDASEHFPAAAEPFPNSEPNRVSHRVDVPLAPIPQPAGSTPGHERDDRPTLAAIGSLTRFLPASPLPDITLPTTRYMSKRGLPDKLMPANSGASKLQPAHWPLIVMLVLTQLGIGVSAVLLLAPVGNRASLASTAAVVTHLGLLASMFHLGKPLKAWRAFLGWRRSWMSREILALGAFAMLATAAALSLNLARPNRADVVLSLKSPSLLTYLGSVMPDSSDAEYASAVRTVADHFSLSAHPVGREGRGEVGADRGNEVGSAFGSLASSSPLALPLSSLTEEGKRRVAPQPSTSLSAPGALACRVFPPLAALVGLFAVFCSAMIYHDTHRPCWRGARSIGRFFGTTLILGLGTLWLTLVAHGFPNSTIIDSTIPLILVLAVASLVKFAGEHRLWRHAESDLADATWPADGNLTAWSLARSARLMRDRLGLLTRARFAAALIGGILIPLASLLPNTSTCTLALISLALCFFAELAERYCFFRCEFSPRMPGV